MLSPNGSLQSTAAQNSSLDASLSSPAQPSRSSWTQILPFLLLLSGIKSLVVR